MYTQKQDYRIVKMRFTTGQRIFMLNFIYSPLFRTLSVNINWLAGALETERKVNLWWTFIYFEVNNNIFCISRQCTYIVFILQCCIVKKILKFTHKKTITFYILLAISSGYLLRVPCPNSVCCASLYIRHRVPGDFMHLVDL